MIRRILKECELLLFWYFFGGDSVDGLGMVGKRSVLRTLVML